jgi:hypothetical protein
MSKELQSAYHIDRTGIWPVRKAKPKSRAKTVQTGTRMHAARQLLRLGPLTFSEFVEITGWPVKTCRGVLSYLVDRQGEVSRLGGFYEALQ